MEGKAIRPTCLSILLLVASFKQEVSEKLHYLFIFCRHRLPFRHYSMGPIPLRNVMTWRDPGNWVEQRFLCSCGMWGP